jgi:hypothetical protein
VLNSLEKGSRATSQLTAIVKSEQVTDGKLNPQWVAWLMGFPVNWTSLDASETP